MHLRTSLAAAAATFLLLAPAAHAADGSIGGTVTDDQTHAAVVNADVIAYDADGAYVASASTDADGHYTLSPLPAGTYRVGYTADGLIAEYYDDHADLSDADGVTVHDGAATTDVNAALAEGATITGMVTDAVSGSPLQRVEVAAVDAAGSDAGYAATDSQGDYTISGLRAGTYTLRFRASGAPYAPASRTATVSAGQTARGADAQMNVHAVVIGTVRDRAGGTPVSGAAVTVFDADGTVAGQTQSDTDGDYALGGLAAGNYRLHFTPPAGVDLASQYFADKPTLAAADPVTTTPGHGATADATLGQGGHITGTVADAATHQALANVSVEVLDADGNSAGAATADGSGAYTVSGLADGVYHLTFEPFDGDHVAADRPGTVTVTAGQTTPAGEQALLAGGRIAGTITDALTGAPVANAYVAALDADGDYVGGVATGGAGSYVISGLLTGVYRLEITFDDRVYADAQLTGLDVTLGQTRAGADVVLHGGGALDGAVTNAATQQPVAGATVEVSGPKASATAVTDANGHYGVGGLPADSYQVHFSAPAAGLGEQYASDPIVVTDGAVRHGVNAALGTAATISGRVTDSTSGVGLAGVTVSANGDHQSSALTGPDGSYAIKGLSAGQYDVEFTPAPGGDYLEPNGQPIALTAGASVKLDSALVRGGRVAGTITGSGGAPMRDVLVRLYDTSGNAPGFARTDANGRYTSNLLAPGTYRAGVSASYYEDQSRDAVTVSAGQTTAGIDMTMSHGGTITGTVSDSVLGAPLAYVRVQAVDASGAPVASGVADGAGRYKLYGLPSGRYYVVADATDSGPGYVSQYYGGTATLQGAKAVDVVTGQVTPGIDVALARAGRVRGTVTNALTGRAVDGVDVLLYAASGDPLGDVYTDNDGHYEFSGLAAGSYRLGFVPGNIAYQRQYYNGKPSLATADPVVVTAGHVTDSLDVALSGGGAIQGTLTDILSHAPLADAGVQAVSVDDGQGYPAVTDAQGHYSVDGLPAGIYQVSADPDEHAHATYTGSASVTVGQITGGIDIQATPFGAIHGTVTAAGAPAAGLRGYVYPDGGGRAIEIFTDDAGRYAVSLAPGTYRVGFVSSGNGDGLLPTYWRASDTLDGADPVTVAAGATTSGIDLTMRKGGTLTGRVTDAQTHAPLSGVDVDVYQGASDDLVATVYTGADGTFTATGLDTGTYRLGYFDSGYHGQYYAGHAALQDADPVSVTSGAQTAGIDAALEPDAASVTGAISGTAIDAVDGHPIAHVRVTAYGDSTFGGSTITDALGHYVFFTLAPGTYTLSFSADAGTNYLPAQAPGTAQVNGGQTSTVADMPLHPGATISGTVTDALTHAPLGGIRVSVGGSSTVVSASDGTYTLDRLPTADLSIIFEDSTDHYITPPVRAVHTTAGQPTTVDAALDPAGALSGTVTDKESGDPVPGMTVIAYRNGNEYRSTTTGANGTYTIDRLPPDAYVIAFTASGYVTQYYKDATTPSAATPVTVTGGTTKTGIDEALAQTPTLLSPPTVSGTARQGETLTAAHASWGHNPTSYALAWQRCDASGANCLTLSGATAATYTVTGADGGYTLRVREIASNAAGASLPAASAPTAIVIGSPPIATARPTVSGLVLAGQTLNEHHGTWTNQPTGYAYRWLRCDASVTTCASIAGATGPAYVVAAADLGARLVAEETASNGGGASVPALSLATSVVVDAVPSSVAAPALSGSAVEGQNLSGSHGSWSHGPTAFTDQWLRCAADGTACAPITGANSLGYTLGRVDVGHRLVLSETASNAGGTSTAVRSAPSDVVTAPAVHADAGDVLHAVAGLPVTLDGSASTPADAIDSAHWDFGDGTTGEGTSPVHAYVQPGAYTARLTVGNAAGSDSATTTVQVVAPAPGVKVTVLSDQGGAIPGADLLYSGADGTRITGVTGADGSAVLQGVPDGAVAIAAYRAGYQPATVQATVAGGVGSVTVTLKAGAVATTSLTSHPLTLDQIQDAGIDTSAPANQNVYQFSMTLAIDADTSQHLCGYVNGDGEFVGDSHFGCAGGGGGGTPDPCSGHVCSIGGGGRTTVTIATVINDHPVIETLVMGGTASVLKQFFSVDMVINNLSPEPFQLTGGQATLALPSGLSLAPTAKPQSLSQPVGTIAGLGSANVNWIVRGDDPGLYYLTASYTAKLQPFDAPVALQATLQDPLHVWGPEALSIAMQIDDAPLKAGSPFRVRLSVTNHADVPMYNVKLGLDAGQREHFLWQPGERFSDTVGTLAPGATASSHTYALVPDGDAKAVNPADSSGEFAGRPISGSSPVQTVPAPRTYELTAPTDRVGVIHLHWEPAADAEGYQIYSIPDLKTPFDSTPLEVDTLDNVVTTRLDARATDALVVDPTHSNSRYYAVATIVDGHPLLEHALVVATEGKSPPVVQPGPGGELPPDVVAPSGETAAYDNGAGAPVPSCADYQRKIGPATVTTACFTQSGGKLQADGAIRINGIDLKTHGKFTIDPKALSVSAGGSVQIFAGSIKLYEGKLDWSFQTALTLDASASTKIKGLPVSGSFSASLTPEGAQITVHAEIAKAEFKVTGEIHLNLTVGSGLQLRNFKLALDGDLPLKGLTVKKAELSYDSESGADVWKGAVDVVLPKGPEVSAMLIITNGALSEASGKIDKINKPIADGIFLQTLGLDLKFSPLTATGEIGVTAGPMIEGKSIMRLDGSLSMTFANPFIIEAAGSLSIADLEVASADVKAVIPGSSSFNGSIGRKVGPAELKGTIGGSVDAHSFEASGSVTVKLDPVSASGSALINNAGLAGCAEGSVFGATLRVGAAHRWSGGDSAFYDACDFGRLRAALSQASGPRAVQVAPKTDQVNLIVQGADAAPAVVLTHGATTATITPHTTGRFGSSVYLAAADDVQHVTYLAIAKPPSGTLTVAAAAGSVVRTVGSAVTLPDPNVHATVKPLGGRRYKLSWTARPNPGQVLRFQDYAGTRGMKQILQTRKAKGTKVFTVAATTGAPRHDVRAFVEQDGLLRRKLVVAHFRPAKVAIGTPKVTVKVRKRVATIGWTAARNATGYEVTAATADGRKLYFRLKARQRSLRITAVTHISVRVRGVDALAHVGTFRSAKGA